MSSRRPGVLDSYRPGYALGREFYTSDELYRAELATIWQAGWLFAAISAEIPEPGSSVLYTVGTASAIIVRLPDGTVAAHHNVCGHRGSLLATEPSGRVRNFTCPYHQWMYGLDGQLRQCRAMPGDFDRSGHGLAPVHVREVAGLIFISFAGHPPDFTAAGNLLAGMAGPQGLAVAKVAHSIDYEIPANWKLVWENNRECYHCDVNHPQYIASNYDRYDEDELPAAAERELELATLRNQERWAASGLALTHSAGLAQFPSADGKVCHSATRTPLVTGYETESMNGARVAPLMGAYDDADVGVLRLRTLPNFWHHGSCDHAVITRLTPAGVGATTARVLWLVAGDADAERDFDLAALLPFWQLTSEQDWQICARQQLGVMSPAYQPGPLSARKEYNVMNFHAWYRLALAAAT